MKKTLLAAGCALLALTGMHSCKEAAPALVEAVTIPINIAAQLVPDDVPALPSFRFVKLETTENSRIEQIEKVIEFDGKLIVLGHPDAAKVHIFDLSGKFLYALPRLPQQGGLRFPSDITVDEAKRSLLVFDQYQKVYEYDLNDGKYIGQRLQLGEQRFYLEAVKGGVLCYDPNLTRVSPYQMCFFREKGDSTNYFHKAFSGREAYLDPGLAKLSQSEVLASSPFCDTVFLFQANGPLFVPRYIFDFGTARGNTPENLEKPFPEYQQIVQDENLLMGPSALNLLGGKLFFNLDSSSSYFGLYDPASGETKVFTRLLVDLPNYYGRAGVGVDEMIYAYEMEQLIEHFGQHEPVTEQGRALKAACVNAGDNPVIIFGSL